MNLTYIGSGHREISTDDLTKSGLDLSSLDLVEGEVRTYHWDSWATNDDIPDVVGEYLLETHRDQFKSSELTTRDLRSKDELYALAQKLQIPNRSKMDRDELAAAVDHEIVEQANESEGETTPEDLLDALDAEGV